MKSVLDPSFHYVPSIKTDIRKTFARIRKEARELSATAPQARAGTSNTVAVLFPDQKAASGR
jgi:hypothetical protein